MLNLGSFSKLLLRTEFTSTYSYRPRSHYVPKSEILIWEILVFIGPMIAVLQLQYLLVLNYELRYFVGGKSAPAYR